MSCILHSFVVQCVYHTVVHAIINDHSYIPVSAQRYRALMVILQSHRTQNVILRCYPTVSAILQRHTKSCLLCFFTIPIFPPFNSQNFLFTCLCSFFTCFAVLEGSIQAGALLRPKNGYLVWSREASSARAHVGRRRKMIAAA